MKNLLLPNQEVQVGHYSIVRVRCVQVRDNFPSQKKPLRVFLTHAGGKVPYL